MKKIIWVFTLCLFWKCNLAKEIDTISISSSAMRKNVKAVVILPDGYEKTNKRFPVVYLLHGYSGSYSQWPTLAPQLKIRATELQIIIICPDGGYGSWYFDSPIDPNFRYETFVAKEVIDYCDKNYRTIADKNHRAITGLSMGGHGGLYLGIRHRDVYGAAGSISGGVDIRPFPKNWEIRNRLGDTGCCKQNWEKNTVINLVNDLKNNDLKLIIDCGVKDFFYPGEPQSSREIIG